MPAFESARQAIRDLTARFRAVGCDSPGLDAELIVAHVLGTDRAGLWSQPDAPLPAAAIGRLEVLAARREDREPVAYITGSRWFREIELAVDGRVLVPRPESELLVEWALSLPDGASLVDVGTGSGAIAIAIALERPDLDVTATDIDREALGVATSNAARLGADLAFSCGDLLDPVPGRPDAVVANLPYIPTADVDGLDPEVARHEPRLALTPGADGLALIDRLIAQAAGRGVGRIALEVGEGQSDRARSMLAAAGFVDIAVTPDLAGVQRVVTAIGRLA